LHQFLHCLKPDPNARAGNALALGQTFCDETLPSFIKQGVCPTVALPFTLKKYLEAKEEFWKFKYFTMQKYKLKKTLIKIPKSFKIS
jgi:hypothetical protein